MLNMEQADTVASLAFFYTVGVKEKKLCKLNLTV